MTKNSRFKQNSNLRMSLFYVITKIHQVYVNYLKLWLFAALCTLRFRVMRYHFKWFKHWSKRTNGMTSLTCLSKQQSWRRLKPIAIFVIGNLLAQQFFVVHFCCLLSVWYNPWVERYLFDTTLRHYLQDELDNCDTAPSSDMISNWKQVISV